MLIVMGERDLLDVAPSSDKLTEYDERHLEDYLRLLDADTEGADWREAVTHIFGVDPEQDPEKVRRFHQTHLDRARWMSRIGYLQLAARGHDKPNRKPK
ncbi:DNA -binding domain-containing protein [Sphingomonas oligoaromativorans]|uniref:DNA -binding domain-containing protein n=1 Tax=Sphingomonas oligoaromativorans TaxID=575322 RepID=UPI001FB93C5F|nr:DUF2285 domain-containing protein [Sphingomonas oligoaromativorans]NIJ34079.1 hypothetical protein [Sphingomonas oligoaromativorans]